MIQASITDEGIRSKSQWSCSLLCANPTQEWNVGSRQRAPQTGWGQWVVTNHVTSSVRSRTVFLHVLSFLLLLPATDSSCLFHLTFLLVLVITIFKIFFFTYPKSNAEPEDREILSCISGRNVHNSHISHNKSIQKDRVKKNTYAFIFIWKKSSHINNKKTNHKHPPSLRTKPEGDLNGGSS